jgi:hypothetical protein
MPRDFAQYATVGEVEAKPNSVKSREPVFASMDVVLYRYTGSIETVVF